MCGRYWFEQETIEKALRKLGIPMEVSILSGNRDCFPGEELPVVTKNGSSLILKREKWGIPLRNDKRLLINARQETVCEKPLFREGILHHRVVIPASGFYEWNANRQKFRFARMNEEIVWLAGFMVEDGFVILTTEPNASIIPVHDRMPLILETEQVSSWILDDRSIESILHQKPTELKRWTKVEQRKLF